MLSSSRFLPLAVALFTGAWLTRSTLAQVSCSFGDHVDLKECNRAISQIVYQKPGNTLDRVSNRFGKLSGNCSIIVQNPNRGVVTKKQIETGFAGIFNECKSIPGSNALGNGVYVGTQDHSLEHDTIYFAPPKLTCGLNSNAPLTVDKDCYDAYNSILVDSQGRLLGDKHTPAPSILKTSKTCTVLIYTTDDSSITVKKSEFKAEVSKAINECKGKSAVKSFTKGLAGSNGLLVLKVRSSKRCGSRVDSEGQLCV